MDVLRGGGGVLRELHPVARVIAIANVNRYVRFISLNLSRRDYLRAMIS